MREIPELDTSELESPELQVARRAARAAGVVLRSHFGGPVTFQGKEPEATYNLVTEADVQAEAAIVRVIREAFPEHALHGEESRQDTVHADSLWIIDPLDGTNNFVHGIPHFAVSIAFFKSGRPECGVIYNPARDDWFQAVRGQGAWHNGRRIRVASSEALDKVLVGVGFYYDRGVMMESTLAAIRDLFYRHIHGIRRFGTASLDLSQVACGRYGAFFEYELSPWDFAAGWLIVEEAGGRITDCEGAPLALRKTSVLATNGRLHADTLQVVRAHLPSRDL